MDTTATLADDFGDLLEAPEGIVSEAQMAWHWEQAGLAEKAALYHHARGRKAVVLALAYEEMRSHITKALDLLATLPESPWRTRYEQLVYLTMGWD